MTDWSSDSVSQVAMEIFRRTCSRDVEVSLLESRRHHPEYRGI